MTLTLTMTLSIARVGFISENYGLISTERLPDNIGVYIKFFATSINFAHTLPSLYHNDLNDQYTEAY